MKLKSLKPRLVVSKPQQKELAVSWRDGKSSAQRGYGYKWQQHRLRFLQLNPLCMYCERDGRVTEATVVDHMVPHKGNKEIFWDESRWQSLCATCHSSVKQREEKAGGE